MKTDKRAQPPIRRVPQKPYFNSGRTAGGLLLEDASRALVGTIWSIPHTARRLGAHSASKNKISPYVDRRVIERASIKICEKIEIRLNEKHRRNVERQPIGISLLMGSARQKVHDLRPDRSFDPSRTLIRLVIEGQKPFPTDADELGLYSPSATGVSEQDATLYVKRAVEGALSSWANDSAKTADVVTKPLLQNDSFDAAFGEWLVRRLNVNVNTTERVLSAVKAELQSLVLPGPIVRSWGRVYAFGNSILAQLVQAPVRSARSDRRKAALLR